MVDIINTDNTMSDAVKERWEKLNKIGIYNMKQLKDYLENNYLDIGVFTSPYKENMNKVNDDAKV